MAGRLRRLWLGLGPTIPSASTKMSSSASTPGAASTMASRRCTRRRSTRLGVSEGETIVQIGAGAGYYTAILATLVGRQGRVIAYEIEPDIAERAAANLARYPQVEVRARSGVDDLPAADAIYVNAAATHPLRAWLDALKPGGRLVFPLQAAGSTGAMLIVTRPERGEAGRRGCSGAWCSSPARARKIPRWAASSTRRSAAAAQSGVRSLRFGGAPSETDWVRGDGWALSTEPAG